MDLFFRRGKVFLQKKRKNPCFCRFSPFEGDFSAPFCNAFVCSLLRQSKKTFETLESTFFPFFLFSWLVFLQNGCIVFLFSDGCGTRYPKHAPIRGDCDFHVTVYKYRRSLSETCPDSRGLRHGNSHLFWKIVHVSETCPDSRGLRPSSLVHQ